jgi:hypothetical protein
MTKAKNIKVTKETQTGRNVKFYDPKANVEMTRAQFVNEIKRGDYSGYHVRKINGLNTPVSNPDHSEGNNLD